MPNKFNRRGFGTVGNTDSKKAPAPSAVTESTANWPGLPGKSGPNRTNGVGKSKAHPKSEGI